MAPPAAAAAVVAAQLNRAGPGYINGELEESVALHGEETAVYHAMTQLVPQPLLACADYVLKVTAVRGYHKEKPRAESTSTELQRILEWRKEHDMDNVRRRRLRVSASGGLTPPAQPTDAGAHAGPGGGLPLRLACAGVRRGLLRPPGVLRENRGALPSRRPFAASSSQKVWGTSPPPLQLTSPRQAINVDYLSKNLTKETMLSHRAQACSLTAPPNAPYSPPPPPPHFVAHSSHLSAQIFEALGLEKKLISKRRGCAAAGRAGRSLLRARALTRPLRSYRVYKHISVVDLKVRARVPHARSALRGERSRRSLRATHSRLSPRTSPCPTSAPPCATW